MKKYMMIVVSCLAIILVSISFTYLTMSRESQRRLHIEQSPASFDIYTNDVKNMDKNDVLDSIVTIAQKYDANITKTNFITKDNIPITVKSIYFSFESPTYRSIPIQNGRFLTANDRNQNVILQTPTIKNTDGFEQVGTLYSFMNCSNVRVQTLSILKDADYDNGLGTYTVELKDPTQLQNFCDDLASMLHIQTSDLQTPKSGNSFFDNSGFYDNLYVSICNINVVSYCPAV